MIVPKERAAQPPQSIKLSKLLLVEGETPAHLFEALATYLKLDDAIEIRSFGGNRQLRKFLAVLSSTQEFRTVVKSLGIARDAEDSPEGAKRAVEEAIIAAKLDDVVKVSTFILPDGTEPGMIETVCLRSVEEERHFGCIGSFVDCIGAQGVELPHGIVRSKHLAQIYLATMSDPQLFPGLAAYKGTWPFDHAAFEPLRAFLIGL